MGRLKVAVRVRPLSNAERCSDSNPVISIENSNTVTITNIKVPEQNAGDSRERIRRFTFDYCFDENSSQDEIFETVGQIVESAIKKQEHSCVLAYGQSSSGKTHTMMGFHQDPGITPRLCQKVLNFFQESATEHELKQMKNTVSYLEIYNEKVRDLLPSDGTSGTYRTLRVREHPKKGPYVQGLSEHQIQDSDALLHWLHTGNGNRKVAATPNNPQSSRSHSVFTITGCGGTKLHLIDLAGSERAHHRYNTTCRFREGANINKSLVALGNVISVLAEKSSKFSRRFVPYRDSLLTWLLRDTLGGNSTTVMIATVSPSSSCYSETVNTLRFGQRAKQIILQPVVNEDPKERTIRELRAEILRLKELLFKSQVAGFERAIEVIQDPVIAPNEQPTPQGTETDQEIDDHPTLTTTAEDPEPITVNVTEELLPVITVSTTVKDSPSPKMQRTSSLGGPSRQFSSEDSLMESKRISKPTRQRSMDKPAGRSKATLLRTGSDPNNPSKKEKAAATESKGLKVDTNSRKPSAVKQRSDIVAAVTERLYAKVKKKGTSTETDQLVSGATEEPKELSICSNARLRLQQLTRQALRAHRRRSEQTQTDLLSVLRVKEIATDVDDLRLSLLEIKDAETDPIDVPKRTIGTDCAHVANFEGADGTNLTVTRSCGTQTSECAPKNVSFTKYLQGHAQPRFEIINPCSPNPIYTSTVNIHVSHNYINRPDNVSDDSLEDHHTVYLPTPDLISNHNSLDAHIHDPESAPGVEQRVKFATMCDSIPDALDQNLECKPVEVCVAKCTSVPDFADHFKTVGLQKMFAPEVCVVKDPVDCKCQPLLPSLPEYQRVSSVEDDGGVQNSAVLSDPVVLKSIMKAHASESESDVSFGEQEEEIPDSLKYHQANASKKVQFKQRSETDHMFRAMSKFLEEATHLLSNLTTVVANRVPSPEGYNFEVTVNDVSGLGGTKRCKKRPKKTESSHPSPNPPTETADWSINTDDYEIIPNKYEKLLEDSCARLERCINKAQQDGEQQRARVWDSRELLHRFPQPFEVWNGGGGESSGESNPTYSDYGSLPKRSKCTTRRSVLPSAFLRQLTSVRQQIVQDSREELDREENPEEL